AMHDEDDRRLGTQRLGPAGPDLEDVFALGVGGEVDAAVADGDVVGAEVTEACQQEGGGAEQNRGALWHVPSPCFGLRVPKIGGEPREFTPKGSIQQSPGSPRQSVARGLPRETSEAHPG